MSATLYYFSSIKNGSISFFSSSGMHQFCRMSCYRQLSAYIRFTCFALFKSIVPSHKSDMNNNFRIILIKTNIVKVNLLRSTLRIPISSQKNVTLPELINIISSLASKASSSFLIILRITNRIRNILILVEYYQQLYHTFIRFYSMRGQTVLQKD